MSIEKALGQIKAQGHPVRRWCRPGTDAVQEFWFGVVRALAVGASPEQAVSRGYAHVEAVNRTERRRAKVATCRSCCRESMPYRQGGAYVCRYCGGSDVSLASRAVALDLEHSTPRQEAGDPIQESRLEAMRPLLSTRERQVFDAITGRTAEPCRACPEACKGGIPHGECDNYLRRISDWLKVTPRAVNEYRERLILKCQAVLAGWDRSWVRSGQSDRQGIERDQRPVEPKPESPRSVAGKSSTSKIVGRITGMKTT